MLRLFKKDNTSDYKDFPNDLFRRPDMVVAIDHESDKVQIDQEEYKLSSILHYSGSGGNSNCASSQIGIKIDLKQTLKDLIGCNS